MYLLTFATTYAMMLVGGALGGVGLAGGAFIVGGVAYTAAWFEPAKQGTALGGIFGAGNVGSAVTNFGAPPFCW